MIRNVAKILQFEVGIADHTEIFRLRKIVPPNSISYVVPSIAVECIATITRKVNKLSYLIHLLLRVLVVVCIKFYLLSSFPTDFTCCCPLTAN